MDSLNAIGELTNDQIAQLIEFTMKLTNEEHRADLLRGATLDEIGRRVAAQVVHERTQDRIADARRALNEYEALLKGGGTTETQMQHFLSRNPLIFGLQYANVRPQVEGPSAPWTFCWNASTATTTSSS